MATQPTAAAPAPGSARELVKALQERNAPRRAEVQRSVAALRRIAEQLRAAAFANGFSGRAVHKAAGDAASPAARALAHRRRRDTE